MTYQISEIRLITILGTFKFAQHHNSDADAYQAMLNFEANNWRMLGDFKYEISLNWNDGNQTIESFSGNNSSANLAFWMDCAAKQTKQ